MTHAAAAAATVPMRARLHHIQLGSPQPEGLARFYEDVMGMAVDAADGRWLCRARDRAVFLAPGEAKTLQFAAYQAADEDVLAGLSARLAAHGVAREPSPTSLFAEDAVAFRDPDGSLRVFGLPRAAPPVPTDPPGRLQHIVVGSRDPRRLVAFYSEVVGLRISDRVLDPQGGLRTCFLRTDDEHHSFAVFETSEDRFDHHCYETPDWNAIRDWGDRLAGKRVPVKWGPGRHGPGNNLFLFFHDPDGNWLEVSAELEVVAPGRPVGEWPHEERTLNTWGQGLLRS